MSIDRAMLLKNLHLYGMAAAWSEWQAEYASQQKPVIPEVWLDRLIEAEQVDRQARSLNYQLKAARFPIHRDLMNFEWQETPLQRARIEQLATAGFMDQAYNLGDFRRRIYQFRIKFQHFSGAYDLTTYY